MQATSLSHPSQGQTPGMPHYDRSAADRYKFGGKELEVEGVLNLYDFEARMYDPALTRFMSPDPLADRYPSVSPYAYCANNPLRFTDPSGMKILDIDQEGNILKITDKTPTDIIRIVGDDGRALSDENKNELSMSFPLMQGLKITQSNRKMMDTSYQERLMYWKSVVMVMQSRYSNF